MSVQQPRVIRHRVVPFQLFQQAGHLGQIPAAHDQAGRTEHFFAQMGIGAEVRRRCDEQVMPQRFGVSG